MAKLILGITGEMVSGKGTISKHIVNEHGGNIHRFSTILRDVLDRIYVEQTRENMATLSTVLRKTFGENLLSRAIYNDSKNDEHEIVVVDGVRRMSDIEYLKELPEFKLIYMEADMEKRYQRVILRGENADDATKTFEGFQRDHEHEAEIQIRDLKNYASYVVNNDGTFADLYKQIDEIIKENLTPVK